MVTGAATARWWAGRDRRAVATAAIGLSDALGVLVAELRAGVHPSDAARVAVDGPVDATQALSAAAAAARLGGDVPAALRGAGSAQLRSWLDRLADAWSLADRYGIPLADLLDVVRSNTEQRVRFAAEVQARLVGPRATAPVLAGLPLLGLALDHAVGASPLQVLSSPRTSRSNGDQKFRPRGDRDGDREQDSAAAVVAAGGRTPGGCGSWGGSHEHCSGWLRGEFCLR
jgi:tight adherence protein B